MLWQNQQGQAVPRYRFGKASTRVSITEGEAARVRYRARSLFESPFVVSYGRFCRELEIRMLKDAKLSSQGRRYTCRI